MVPTSRGIEVNAKLRYTPVKSGLKEAAMEPLEKKPATHALWQEEMLDFSRQNMVNALDLFFKHTKYSLTLLTTILAASLAIAAFSFDKLEELTLSWTITLVVASTFLVLMGPVSYITYRLVGRYYRLYVSFYIYAARLHDTYASSIEHPWFVDLKDKLGEPYPENLYNKTAVSRFMDKEIRGGSRNSWYFYQWLILILGASGTLGGSAVLGLFFIRFPELLEPILTLLRLRP